MADNSHLFNIDLIYTVLMRFPFFNLDQVAVGQSELTQLGTHVFILSLHHVPLQHEFSGLQLHMVTHDLLQLTESVVLPHFDLDGEHTRVRVLHWIVEQKSQSVLVLGEFMVPSVGV